MDDKTSVVTKDPLVSFLYELMRDHVVPGTVEKIVQNDLPYLEAEEGFRLSNGHLARYAEDVAARLRNRTQKGASHSPE